MTVACDTTDSTAIETPVCSTEKEYDVFISYAAEDGAGALTLAVTLRTKGLRCYLYTPARAATSSVLRLLADRLGALFQCNRAEGTQASTSGVDSSPDYSEPLAAKLERAASVLVLWSQSHRGSFWSRWEVAHFERTYPQRPIFVLPVDGTSLSWPSPQWRSLDTADQLTPAHIARPGNDASQAASADLAALTLRQAVLDPLAWTIAVGRLRSGTSWLELMRLHILNREQPTEAASMALRTSVRLLSIALAASAMLCIIAILLVLYWGDNIDFARHHALILIMSWGLVPIVGMQAPVAALALAALLATALGLAVEVSLGHAFGYPHAEPAASAALGTFFGILGAYEWSFRSRSADCTPIFRYSKRLLAVGALAGLATTLVIMLCAALALAPQQGNLEGPLTVPIALALTVLPGIAVWQEMSRGGRGREALKRGVIPMLGCLAVGGAIGAIVWTSALKLPHHGNVHSGLVAGAIAAICVGAAHVAPGFVLGVGVPAEIRTVTSIFCVSLSFLALHPLLSWTHPGDKLLANLGAAYLAYFPCLGFVYAVARMWVERNQRPAVPDP